jgi:hypothetical protein
MSKCKGETMDRRRITNLIIVVVVLIALAGGYYFLKGNSQKTASTVGSSSPTVGGQIGGSPGRSGQFAEFRKLHPYTFQLMRLVGNISRLEEDGKAALTPKQAKAILAILEPLRQRASLDESVARDTVKDIRAILTDKQHAAISALPAEPQFRRSNRPPSGAPPSGAMQGPPRNSGPGPMRDMKEFNPLNPPTGGPSNRPGSNRIDKLFDSLKKKSDSK